MPPTSGEAFADPSSATPKEGPDSLGLFATSRRTQPLRTYSHDRKKGRPVPLPPLKPEASGVRLKRFRIGNANTWEIKPSWPDSPEHLQTAHTERDLRQHNGAEGDAVYVQERTRVTSSSSALPQEEEPPSSSAGAPPSHASECADPDIHDDDDDDIIVFSQRSQDRQPVRIKQMSYITRALRRRPFLMFDKTEPKGYKQLKDKAQHIKTPQKSSYQPGDGFSGPEAKPDGSNLLARHGKLSLIGPRVGVLDLTQSEQLPTKPKRKVRRANLNDNSFAPAVKKQARRPLEPKDPNQQQPPGKGPLTQMKTTSSALDAATNNHRQDKDTSGVSRHQPGPEDNSIMKNAHTGSSHPDGDTTIIEVERSDDGQGNCSKCVERHGVLADDGPDSCEAHVSDTSPPHQVKVEANSRSPAPSLQRHVSTGTGVLPERVFRRVNTQ